MWAYGVSLGLAAIRQGDKTAEDWARSCLERVTARDPKIKAWAWWDSHRVIEEAREIDKGDPNRPLQGVPVGIKDIMMTSDMPTQFNSPIYRDFFPKIDAACVAVIRAAGGLVFGKTETVEFASNARKALTRNPHDLSRTPGGSSSGSAAAVADGHVPVALGTQTAGSIIRPASFCGVYAFKPTWGLVSTDGVKSYSPTLDTIGWYCRDPLGLAKVFEAFDVANAIPLESSEAKSLADAKVGICQTPYWHLAAPETQHLLAGVRRRLQALGSQVEDIELPAHFGRLNQAAHIINRAEGRASFLPEFLAEQHRLHPFIRDHYLAGAEDRAISLVQAYDLAARCRSEFDELASGFDFIIAPSSAGFAPQGLQSTGDPVFNAMWTLLHAPCINLPGAEDALTLPLGYTIVSHRFNDQALLGYASQLMRAGVAKRLDPQD
ncbi:MAG: amidase [Pigmentiphaga sp.]|nr:amidase [Pigmentiphaga sp.]